MPSSGQLPFQMAISSRPSGDEERRVVSSVLADPSQRRLVGLLLERSCPMTTRDLAVGLATDDADGDDGRPAAAPGTEVRQHLIELHHRYLPRFEAIGWIRRQPEGIVTTDRFPFADPAHPLPPVDDPDAPWDALAVLYARPRRLHLVSVLARPDRDDPLTLEDLVAELTACDGSPWSSDDDRLPPAVALHHVDLPLLASIDLLGYDPDERTVTTEPRLRAVAALVATGDG